MAVLCGQCWACPVWVAQLILKWMAKSKWAFYCSVCVVSHLLTCQSVAERQGVSRSFVNAGLISVTHPDSEKEVRVEVARQREVKWLDMFHNWDKWIKHRFQKVFASARGYSCRSSLALGLNVLFVHYRWSCAAGRGFLRLLGPKLGRCCPTVRSSWRPTLENLRWPCRLLTATFLNLLKHQVYISLHTNV